MAVVVVHPGVPNSAGWLGAGEFFGRGLNESPGLWFAGALWPTSPLISCEGVGERHLSFTQLP